MGMMLGMKKKLNNFKCWLEELIAIQDLTPNRRGTTKEDDLRFLIGIAEHMEPKVAGEKEKPLLDYGTFFDGQHVHYDEKAEQLDQKTFNMVMFNHLIHFISGAHFQMPVRPTKSAGTKYVSITALYLAHFGISGVKPRYARSIRKNFYEQYHIPEKGYGLLFAPDPNVANYFYEEYTKGNIELPKGFCVKEGKRFDCAEGIIYLATTPYAHLTQGRGIEFDRNPSRYHYSHYYYTANKVIALKREENGDLRRVDLVKKEGRELLELKKVYDSLVG